MLYEFGPFQLDSKERILRRNSKQVALTPKVFDLLLVLIQHRGRVLTKDELMKQVWADTVVEEGNVSRNVSTLRRALADGPQDHRFIETIPWRGYRFAGDVKESSDESTGIDSLAVLPFLNETADPDTEYLADGIAESLIRKLSVLTGLRVMSRHSVFNCKSREPRAVGRELDVRAVLTGRIHRSHEIFIVNVELVDARDGRHLWGAQYNREPSDVLGLQETIAQQIAERLRVRLTTNEMHRLHKRHTDNPEAAELYLKGRFYWNKLTLDTVKKSIECFRQATEKDAGYALAYTGLLDGYTYLNSPSEARKAAVKALELDPALGEVHASLGFFTFLYDWDFQKAESEFNQAVELSPNYAEAHHWFAIYLANMGRHQEALQEAKRARQLDPISLLMNQTVGLTLYLAHSYDEAVEELQKVIDMDANYAAARSTLGLAYAKNGNGGRAVAEFQKVGAMAGGNAAVDVSVKALIGYALALSGNVDEARRLAGEISNLPAAPSYLLAMIFSALGEKDRAFEWLDRAYQERNVQLVCAKADPALDPLRSDGKFQTLLARVGL